MHIWLDSYQRSCRFEVDKSKFTLYVLYVYTFLTVDNRVL